MSKMTDLDFVIQTIGQGRKGRRKKNKLEDHQLRDENGNLVFKTVTIDGQEYKAPVYGEIKPRPKIYGRIKGKQTSDAKLVAKGDLHIEE